MSAMGYEWHWRLDDDSRLSEPVGYDVFQLMATNNMLYSYLDIVQVIYTCLLQRTLLTYELFSLLRLALV